ncbi:MAG TPA: hypothetical protein VE173_02245 [Longimicrobiales bacterium]|nr:hypothetical protein [Longimicrobiales bacterium]
MRTFEDWNGRKWLASVVERPGPDYKGRYHFRLGPLDSDDSEGLSLTDIRWNSERTAERTLETMSVVELRRRLRQALGRGAGATAKEAPAGGGGDS